MGMGIYGKNPTSEKGEYFRASVWRWHPLARLCQHFAPKICRKCQHWHTNDGSGLSSKDSKALAAVLEKLLADGTIDSYIRNRDVALATMPSEPCPHCNGTGTRNDEYVKGTCNGCSGIGKVRPYATMYTIDKDNVEAWVAFLKNCGGFKIC